MKKLISLCSNSEEVFLNIVIESARFALIGSLACTCLSGCIAGQPPIGTATVFSIARYISHPENGCAYKMTTPYFLLTCVLIKIVLTCWSAENGEAMREDLKVQPTLIERLYGEEVEC